jgi:guanylate kinase
MAEETKHRGLLIVLVGPSGVGKSTISRRLAQQLNVWYTVSDTTRPKMSDEELEGKVYEHIEK